MTYKNKLIVLSSVIAALAIVYIITIFFDPQRAGSRSDLYSWLEPGQNDKITGISITKEGETAAQETINLSRNGGKWFVTHDGKDYPARQVRVDDFIAALAKRGSYPVYSSSASSHERLSLTPDRAAQVTVSAGAGLPLLTLLIGQTDITGQNVYLRKQGQNEVRSGEDRFSSYTAAALSSWYNLRLFPENEEGKFNEQDIQRLIVYHPGEETPRIFTRSGREWTFNFELPNPDISKINSYLRDILGVSGDDFAGGISPSDSMFNTSRIILELGNGATTTLRLGPADENGRCYATVSGSDIVYSIPGWAAGRLLVDKKNFEQ
ncbi:MAG: DUF4340 domain-containing protein [Treponema sp.]|jgi:hypothetical protein|nr:DUF4340 domain-containing protein [Treponema sp.]